MTPDYKPVTNEEWSKLKDEAERLASYWELHGDDPKTVSKWAVGDLLGLARWIAERDE